MKRRGRKGSVAVLVLMALVLALSGAPVAAADWMIYVTDEVVGGFLRGRGVRARRTATGTSPTALRTAHGN